VGGRLAAVGADLARVTPLATTLGDEALTGNLTAAQGKLARLRDTLNSDPLALWQPDGTVDTSGADRLAERVTAAASRADELAQLRDEAHQRVTEITTAAASARSAREDAVAAWQQATVKIAAGALPPPPPDMTDLSGRLADLGTPLAGGRWTRLASERHLLDPELARAAAGPSRTGIAILAGSPRPCLRVRPRRPGLPSPPPGRHPAVPGPAAGAGGVAVRRRAGWAPGWWRSRRCRTATRPAPSWPTRRSRPRITCGKPTDGSASSSWTTCAGSSSPSSSS